MAAKIEMERKAELLVLRLKGSIGFSEEDFQMRDDLIAQLREHISNGAQHLLVDFSETSFIFPSSFGLLVEPFPQKDILGDSRIAVCFKGNSRMRDYFHITRVDKILDCFETEEEALHFLQSDTPMVKDIKQTNS